MGEQIRCQPIFVSQSFYKLHMAKEQTPIFAHCCRSSFYKRSPHSPALQIQSVPFHFHYKEGQYRRHHHQCDQICRNCTTLAKSLKYWAILGVFIYCLAKILELLWQVLYAIGQMFFHLKGQMLKNNQAIWSHWSSSSLTFRSNQRTKNVGVLSCLHLCPNPVVSFLFNFTI